MIAQVVEAENPVAASCPDLLTQEERDQALKTLRRQLDSEEIRLPEPLVE